MSDLTETPYSNYANRAATGYAHRQAVQDAGDVRRNYDYSEISKRKEINVYVYQLWQAQSKVLQQSVDRCFRAYKDLGEDHNNCRYITRLRDQLLINGRPFTTLGDGMDDPTLPDHLMAPPEGWRRIV